MRLCEILQSKGSDVHSIGPEATMSDVVQALVRHNCGSLIVLERPGDRRSMCGIVTERDLLRCTARRAGELDQVSITDCMTRDVVTAAPHDSVEEAMGVMTARRVRHLPVVDEGQLVGLVSIGDVVKALYDEAAFENHHLKSYLHG